LQRITISIDENLASLFDRLIAARAYESRSEGVRDLLREAVERWLSEQSDDGRCVANLSYVFNRNTRALPDRLSQWRHEAHDLIVAATQAPMDHDHTLETVLLRGQAAKVRAFADKICAERGVRFGALNLIAVELSEPHSHADAAGEESHAHLAPRRG